MEQRRRGQQSVGGLGHYATNSKAFLVLSFASVYSRGAQLSSVQGHSMRSTCWPHQAVIQVQLGAAAAAKVIALQQLLFGSRG